MNFHCHWINFQWFLQLDLKGISEFLPDLTGMSNHIIEQFLKRVDEEAGHEPGTLLWSWCYQTSEQSKEKFDEFVSTSRLPDVYFWKSKHLEPKIKKVELEQVTKIWNTRSFDRFPSLQDLSCLFLGGWLDDSIIMDILSVFLDSLDLNSEIFILDPVFVQGLPTSKKKSPLDGHKYVFFPYNWKRVHWCLFVLEVSSKNILVFDSLIKTKNEYRESILCFLYICKHYLGIKDLALQSVIENVQPPSSNS